MKYDNWHSTLEIPTIEEQVQKDLREAQSKEVVERLVGQDTDPVKEILDSYRSYVETRYRHGLVEAVSKAAGIVATEAVTGILDKWLKSVESVESNNRMVATIARTHRVPTYPPISFPDS